MAALTRWEYTHLEANTANVGGLVNRVNRAAARGWEVVDIAYADKTLGLNSMFALMRRALDHPADPDDTSPGWKTDPVGSATERYWDGQLWTEQVRGVRSETDTDAPEPDPEDKDAWRAYLGANATNKCKNQDHGSCNRGWCTCRCHAAGPS